MHIGVVYEIPVCAAQVQLVTRKCWHTIHSSRHCGTAVHVAGGQKVCQRRQNTHHTGTPDSHAYKGKKGYLHKVPRTHASTCDKLDNRTSAGCGHLPVSTRFSHDTYGTVRDFVHDETIDS